MAQPQSGLQEVLDFPAAMTTGSPEVQENSIPALVEEETETPHPAQNALIAKTTGRIIKRRPLNEKAPTIHQTEELVILPSTSDQGMETVLSPSDNRLASPGLLSDEQVTQMPGKENQSPSVDVSTIPPPSTLLHRQTFPNDMSDENEDQPLDWKYQNTPEYVSKHPKCALNLVCYRAGAKHCELHQIQTVLESRFQDREAFQRAIKESPSLIATDAQFFRALRDVYQQKMCGFWRKALFLKTLRGIRLLSV
jgi:hypothetical protein